jgi:UDP-N-acetylmuramate dehydrogenase
MSIAQHILENIPLSGYTTIGLGGPARYFLTADSRRMLEEGLQFAIEKNVPVHILGGGSNIVVADEGFHGLVLHIGIQGITLTDEPESVLITAAAGEPLDRFVQSCIDRGLGGIECLSGIPGSIGATPIQNVGAYGQEISETMVFLHALERRSLKVVEFSAPECRFGYRQSRFKRDESNRYIVLDVTFRLKKNARPVIRYPELQKIIDVSGGFGRFESGKPVLQAVREAILALRRQKSMVIDPHDPDSRSVGSFFTNPILTQESFQSLVAYWKENGDGNPIPSFGSAQGVKVSAAWLVENAGFHRGYKYKRVGISQKHSLALVNYAGTTNELLELAEKIQSTVLEKFSLQLEREPIIVQ